MDPPVAPPAFVFRARTIDAFVRAIVHYDTPYAARMDPWRIRHLAADLTDGGYYPRHVRCTPC